MHFVRSDLTQQSARGNNSAKLRQSPDSLTNGHDWSRRLRRAAAAVELAVCLPVIIILVFGAIEGANILFCRQALVEAAYEASKHASRADGTTAHANTLATDILKARRVNNATITITPANVALAKPGQEVSVNIKVSAKERTYTNLGLFDKRTIEVTATMQKD